MPRTYKRKTNRGQWSQDALLAAMHEVQEGTISCNEAASRYEIPEPTLRRYIKKSRENKELPSHAGRYRNTFNAVQTREFVAYVKQFSERGLGLTRFQFRKLAYEYAEKNNIEHRFNHKKKTAGQDWYQSFTKNNRLSLRTPEATSIGRLMGFNKVAVDRFFELLKSVRAKYNFSADQIFNADESGVSTVPTRLPKILTPTGNRRVIKIVSAERGKNTTVVCAMSAAGAYIPPFFIFARKRMKPELLNGSPPCSVGIAQSSGWMTAEGFVKYLKHFTYHAKPSAEHPVLLIVDNHTSHISLDAINYCRSNNIVLVGLPPHTTHRLQPLDVAFFGPLKAFYNQACDSFMVNQPGTPITDKNVGPMFGEAYGKAATINNAVNGFSACGIEPFKPQVFQETDFAPAATSERSLPQLDVVEQVTTNRRDSIENPEELEFVSDDDIPLVQLKARGLFTPAKKIQQPSSSISRAPSVKCILFSPEPEPSPSCSVTQSSNSLWNLRPLPTIHRPNQNKRTKVTASIISSTPVKRQLEEKQKLITEKEEKKNEKRKNILQKTQKKVKVTPVLAQSSSCFCFMCDEPYTEPPKEDWIQCGQCLQWCHEDCSSYEGQGQFICDTCL